MIATHTTARINSLSMDDLRAMVPSAFAKAPAADVSDRYAFVPSAPVIEEMFSRGFVATKASESYTRIAGHKGFQKHLIRFAQPDQMLNEVGQERFEVVFINSHDRSSGVQVLGGVFRLVCSNGLIIGNTQFAARARHTGNPDDIVDAAFTVVNEAPKAGKLITEMKQIELSKPEQMAFAESALEIMPQVNKPSAATILYARRKEDNNKDDLWTTFNRVQENITKGGIRPERVPGQRTRRTREIKSIDANTSVNKALWTLAEKMKELKTAA